jgi:phosphoribosylpyrophosphate synthetase
MQKFEIQSNDFLKRTIQAFFHTDYVGFQKHGNPDYLNSLKNQLRKMNKPDLDAAVQKLRNILLLDLPQISKEFREREQLTVCVVPRAKEDDYYSKEQLLFKTTVRSAVKQCAGFVDGIDYIKRHTDTRTTHLNNSKCGGGDGDMPYPGITINTCNISEAVKDKDILLIDDIYTKTINIDEDAIQALLNKGARTVVFYAVAKTKWSYYE